MQARQVDQQKTLYAPQGNTHLLQQSSQLARGNTPCLATGHAIFSREARVASNHYVMMLDRKRAKQSKLRILCHSPFSKNDSDEIDKTKYKR